MLAELEQGWVQAAQAEANADGLLPGISTVFDGPLETDIPADWYFNADGSEGAVLEVVFAGGIPVFRQAGVIEWTGTHYVRLLVQSADTLQNTKRRLQTLMWSANGEAGLVKFLEVMSGIKVNGQKWLLTPGKCEFRFAKGPGESTFAVQFPLTAITIFG